MTGETIHATTVAVQIDGTWRAVLLTGRSGSGKSDLALRMIDRGAMLVADDYTQLHRDENALIATAPARIVGRIEVRGLGIVTVPHLPKATVALLAVLDAAPDRLPEPQARTVAGVSLPMMALAPFEASAVLKLERALAMGGVA